MRGRVHRHVHGHMCYWPPNLAASDAIQHRPAYRPTRTNATRTHARTDACTHGRTHARTQTRTHARLHARTSTEEARADLPRPFQARTHARTHARMVGTNSVKSVSGLAYSGTHHNATQRDATQRNATQRTHGRMHTYGDDKGVETAMAYVVTTYIVMAFIVMALYSYGPI